VKVKLTASTILCVSDDEDEQLKNQLYTCCKAGDITRLSMLLERLGVALPENATTSCVAVNPQATSEQEKMRTISVTASSKHSEISSEQKSDSLTKSSQNNNGHTHPSDSQTALGVLHKNSPQATEGCSIVQPSSSAQGVCDANSNTCSHQTRSASQELGVCEDHTGQSHDKGDNASQIQQQQRFEQIILGKYGSKGSSLLHVAASSGHASVVTALLEAGCNPALRFVFTVFA
jgi:hypothetical protein